jgi:hypothetical protein
LRLLPSLLAVSMLFLTIGSTGASANDEHGMQWRLRDHVGGGNLVTHLAGKSTQLYQALHGVGAGMGRMDSYGWRTLAHAPTPRDFDAAMLEAHGNGIQPIILLEYEGSYQTLDPPQPIGSYADWFAAGQAMAQRFRPNGDWGRENGIADWGVTIFTAINEPDVQATIPRDAYHDALAGLADGVHSLDSTLRVVPGGFATCNSHGDATLRGYGPAIADLFEDGRLDGIDLHTYYNDRWYPMSRGREFSVQSCFDRVKQAMGLKRNIKFYSTEFNVARAGAWEESDAAARLFLSAVWDQLAVVGSDGHTPAVALAFPWNLGDTPRVDGLDYAMAVAENPWLAEARSLVFMTVLQLAGDLSLVSSDRRRGLIRLQGTDAELIVWQNLPGWTDRPGPAVELELPEFTRSVEIWGWDGLRRRMTAHGGRFVIDGLNDNETYMFFVPKM